MDIESKETIMVANMARREESTARRRAEKQSRLPLKSFGEDHWTLLAYIDVCCSGRTGRLEHRHLRSKPTKKSNEPSLFKSSQPEPETGSLTYDDWDCLADLEAVGFVELVSYATGLVHIFPGGLKAAAALRAHGERGESIKTFSYL
jgi:hypothetical protein